MVDKYELRDEVLKRFESLTEKEQIPWVLRVKSSLWPISINSAPNTFPEII